MSTVRVGYATPNGVPASTLELRTKLAELLRLAEHGIQILAVRMFGNGPSAGLEVDLSGDVMIECEKVGELSSAAGMSRWVTWSVGINAGKITKADATEACTIMRQLATILRERRVSDLGRDHGLGFLRYAPIEVFRLHDQADRWRAFVLLDALDPAAEIQPSDRFERARRPDAATIAGASIVLMESATGWRYVHTGHFFSFVRASGQASHPAELAKRMILAGWERTGKRGDIKATRPEFAGTLRLRFWQVRPGWEEAGDDEGDEGA